MYLLFRITLLLTISTMCSVLASTYARAEIVRNISIDGNARTGDNVILSSMPFKIGDNILEKDINDATKQLYASGYFSDVSVDMNYGNVVVKVLESPIVSGIYFTGNGKLGDKEIKKELLTKEMQTYSKNKVKFDLDRMYSVYQKMGYLGAQIEPKVVFLENNTVDLIFDIKEGDLSHIDEIIFSGNDNYSASTLKDVIFSRERSMFALTDKSGQFKEDTIAEDTRALTEFYQNRGYAKMHVEKAFATLNKDDYNFTLNFFINEGKVYKFGNSTIRTEHAPFQNNNTLRKAIKSKKGSKFSLEKLQETTTEMAEYLNSNGFANVVPTYELHYDDEAQTVDVEYVLNATEKFYIDRIKISGNVTTKDQVILRELMIHEGDIYNAKLIEESRDRLYMLGFFKNVEMKENFIPNSDLIELEIKVEEQLFASLNFSAGWSNYFGIIGSVNAQINNLFGRGYSAGIGLERSGWSESVHINFYDPYFFKNYNIGMGISGFASKFGNLGGGTKYTSMMLYKGYSYGGNLTFGFELATRLMLQFSLGMAHYTYKMMAATGFRLYDQLLGTRNSNTVGLTLTWNRMNRARYATKGFMLQYSITFAGLGLMGGQQFMQNSAQLVVNHQLFGEDLILHTELMGGIVTKLNKSKQIGFENLYSLGGYQMRGFNFFGIGPRIARYGSNGTYNTLYYAIEALQYYYATLELRSPLFLPKDIGVYLSAFVDIGSAWGFAGKLNKKSYTIDGVKYKESVLDSAMMRMSAGVAINWQSPMGEIGLYYARPIIKKSYDTPLEFGIKFGAQY